MSEFETNATGTVRNHQGRFATKWTYLKGNKMAAQDDLKIKDPTRGQIELKPRTTYAKPKSGAYGRMVSGNTLDDAIQQIESEGVKRERSLY